MCRILIVDDEQKIRAVIREYCEFHGYEVEEAKDGMEAVKLCQEQDFGVVILDVMLPRLDGFSACKEIRRTKDVPVIMLSARGEEYDKLFGFELGIDDYIVKPFSPAELMARIKAVLRRRNQSGAAGREAVVYQGLKIDPARRAVSVDGETVSLAPKDMELLLYLVQNRDVILSREKILSDVWGYEFFGNDRVVDTHIRTIRNCLGVYRDLLVTQRNGGYKFEVPQ
ncbi:MAG: response regulator transcription factor [Firmicutes bacterium]|nr:response regulator transcription factor [Bacillota bacterium]MBR0179967.1 response regulator transcription factor [Bacillota bacterium]